jgi:hypothetical protein
MINPFFQDSFVADYCLPVWVYYDYALAFLHSGFAVVVVLFRPHLQEVFAFDLGLVSDLDWAVLVYCLDLNLQPIHPTI